MRRLVTGLPVLAITAYALAAAVPVREVVTRSVAPGSQLPADLAAPEGKTRWHLESLAAGAAATVSISTQDNGVVQETRRAGPTGPDQLVISGTDAERWLLPDRDPAQMKMGARVSLRFDETRDGLVDQLVADVATVGIGWLHLPDGPHEVVLQRALLLRQRAGERTVRPDLLIHRFVSPREGVLTTITGPASADGSARFEVTSIEFVEKVVTGAATMKIYANQLYRGTFVDLKYGYDKGSVAPSALVPPGSGVTNMCDLANLSTWDFSGVTTGQQTATTETPSSPAETCNAARCGYAGSPVGGGMQAPLLERLDRNLTGTIRKDNQVVQREDRATDVTFWLRAGTQNENVGGLFGSGETGFCFTYEDEVGKHRKEVPVWQLRHNDAGGWYTQAGDTWQSDPVTDQTDPSCQETFYALKCGAPQPFTPNPLWGRACTFAQQTYAGKQSGKIVKGGVVILPSGHTLNALLLRNTTEFCVYSDDACTSNLDRVRTIVYIWEAPFVGSVALVRGPKKVDLAAGETETPCANFTTLEFTDISYGLLPPVSITAGAVTDSTVSLSWNPGNDTHRITGPKIYWDTDPGASTAYAFNSVANAGQVVFAGTTATISGLTAGTTYYFTVTSLSDFTDPSTGPPARHYESILYPTTVSGDPSFSYPVEVSATTTGGTCIPSQEVTGLTVDKSSPNVHACWNATTDACAVGYDVLASDDKTSDASWTTVGQVGLTTCWDGDPSQTYLLVRARGTGGNGPWGHYLH